MRLDDMNKEQKRDEYIRWCNLILEEGKKVTKWEEDFTDSVLEQMSNGGYLSVKQADILERIYAERT